MFVLYIFCKFWKKNTNKNEKLQCVTQGPGLVVKTPGGNSLAHNPLCRMYSPFTQATDYCCFCILHIRFPPLYGISPYR